MNSKKGLFSRIYAKLPNYIRIIIEDLLVFAAFLLILISFKISMLSSVGICLTVILLKYMFIIISRFLPFRPMKTALSKQGKFSGNRWFLGFSILFMLFLFILRFFEAKPEFIAYCLVLFTVFCVLGWFYKNTKLYKTGDNRQIFMLVLLGKLALMLVLTLILFFIGYTFFIDIHIIPTSSMSPTVHPSEVVLSDKLAYITQEPTRWDIAIMKHPGYDYKMLKRIVSMPGEEIEIAGGNVWINGKTLVRPQNVLLSQMRKTPISFINFEKRFADDPSRHKNVRMQFSNNSTEQHKEDWSSVLGENMGNQRNPQTQPLNNDEIIEEFKNWWLPECISQISPNYFRMLPLNNREKHTFSLLLDSMPYTDVNNIKTLTDDIVLQLDASLHNPQKLRITCISESIEEAAVYTFEIDFKTSEMKIASWMKDKQKQKSLGEFEKTFKLHEIKNRNLIQFQIIDGIPAAIINNQLYKPIFEPLSVFYKLENFRLGASFKMDSADIYSIGLFTPTFYYPKGVLKSGEKLAIPKDCYIVLGDNSSFSQDSRDFEILNVEFTDGTKKLMPRSAEILENVESQWHSYYPFVRREDILSRAFAVYKPIELARFIK